MEGHQQALRLALGGEPEERLNWMELGTVPQSPHPISLFSSYARCQYLLALNESNANATQHQRAANVLPCRLVSFFFGHSRDMVLYTSRHRTYLPCLTRYIPAYLDPDPASAFLWLSLPCLTRPIDFRCDGCAT